MDHFEELMKDIKKPQAVIDHSELQAYGSFEQALVSLTECLICKNLPVEPRECSKCSVVFCEKCINKHRDLSLLSSSRCPQCQQQFND